MKKSFFLSVFVFSTIYLNAQSTYIFQTENLPYQNLNGGISLNNGEIWDDPAYTIPLGFDFVLGELSYNTIYFPADGLGAVLTTFHSLEFGSTGIIMPIGQDVVDLGETTGTSLSPISYKIEGSNGNHILKVEWNNAGFWDDPYSSDFMNFQVWLYEGTNILEYRYGPSQIDTPLESYEEEEGPIVVFAPLIDNDNEVFAQDGYFLTGDPANPNVIVLTDDNEPEGSLVGNIPNGTVYRFTPQSLSVDDFTQNDFRIYPNPSSDYLNIVTHSSDYNFSVYNSLGQKMVVKKNDDRLDISNLSNGIYFINIETETGSVTTKFIKH